MRNACKILVGKPEEKRRLGRPVSRWQDSSRTVAGQALIIKRILKE
jgi:hypothetical protein